MTGTVLVSYAAHTGRGHSTALRVWSDGRVETGSGNQDWQLLTLLGPQQIETVRRAVHAAGLFSHKAAGPTAAPTAHGGSCIWHAHDDGRDASATVEPWNDDNPDARPLRALVLQIDAVVGAAQDGHRA